MKKPRVWPFYFFVGSLFGGGLYLLGREEDPKVMPTHTNLYVFISRIHRESQFIHEYGIDWRASLSVLRSLHLRSCCLTPFLILSLEGHTLWSLIWTSFSFATCGMYRLDSTFVLLIDILSVLERARKMEDSKATWSRTVSVLRSPIIRSCRLFVTSPARGWRHCEEVGSVWLHQLQSVSFCHQTQARRLSEGH